MEDSKNQFTRITFAGHQVMVDLRSVLVIDMTMGSANRRYLYGMNSTGHWRMWDVVAGEESPSCRHDMVTWARRMIQQGMIPSFDYMDDSIWKAGDTLQSLKDEIWKEVPIA